MFEVRRYKNCYCVFDYENANLSIQTHILELYVHMLRTTLLKHSRGYRLYVLIDIQNSIYSTDIVLVDNIIA